MVRVFTDTVRVTIELSFQADLRSNLVGLSSKFEVYQLQVEQLAL